MKDAIRRRGENISSFEVEAEVCAHPAVKEAAAVAVPSELAEDEVMVVVSLVEGASLEPAELIRFLIPRMAHFMNGAGLFGMPIVSLTLPSIEHLRTVWSPSSVQ